MKLLADIPLHTPVRVTAVSGTDDISLRLLEMGVTPGTEVTIIGRAPLGDPLELELRGYHLSVRRAEAQRVEVQLAAADS